MVRFLFVSFTLIWIALSAHWAGGYMFFIDILDILMKRISDPTGN